MPEDLEVRRQMTAVVRAWHTSDESRAAFASRHGVSLAKLGYWQRRLRPARSTGAQKGFAAVAVVPTAEPMGPGVVELVLAGGDRLLVRADASLPLVRTVLTALRARC